MKLMPIGMVLCLATGCAGTTSPCGIVKTANDVFAGPQRSFSFALSRQSWASLRVLETKDKRTLTVVATLDGESLESASAGDVGLFAVGDRVVELRLTKAAAPIRETTPHRYVVTRWLLEYDVPDDKAALFAHGAVTEWKANLGTLPLRLVIPTDRQRLLQQGFGCMLQPAKVASAAE